VPITVYKICDRPLWRDAESIGLFRGAPVDENDGYIHFSTAAQVAETAAKHFGGGVDLLLVAVDADLLDGALKWEPSRGGDLFPHLYAPLQLAHVLQVDPLPLRETGTHDFSGLVP